MNFVAIHWLLVLISVLEVTILFAIRLIEYVFLIKKTVSLKVFNTIKDKNESKTLSRHISCGCTCDFDGRKCYSRQKWNSDKCGIVLSVKILTYLRSLTVYIGHVKIIMPGILLHVLASVIRIERLVNT